MDSYFASGRAADVILIALAIEGLWLAWRKWSPLEVLAMLLPAALIVLGLRGALTGADWPWIAGPLALSLPAHLLDLALRSEQSRHALLRMLGPRRLARRNRGN